MSKDKENKLTGKLPKPRNPVAQNLPKKSGGGKHVDQKKRAKQGDSKHPKKDFDLQESNTAQSNKGTKPYRAIPDARHKPNPGDDPVTVDEKVLARLPDVKHTVVTGQVTRISPQWVYIFTGKEELRFPHEDVSKHYNVLHSKTNAELKQAQKTARPQLPGLHENYQNHLAQRLNEALKPTKRKGK